MITENVEEKNKKMAELKTKKNDKNVDVFLNSIEEEQKRKDAFEIADMMKSITGEEPKMWGDSIVGYGDYHYKYATGREGDWFQTGFSPRKQNLTLYLSCGINEDKELSKKLGIFKSGVSCLYIKKLDDIDRTILKDLIRKSVNTLNKKQGN